MSAVARLARFISGSLTLRAAGREEELELDAREAFRSAVIFGTTEPLVPAVPARQTGPAARLEPAPEGSETREGLDPGPPGPAAPAAVGGHAVPEVGAAASAALALPWRAPAASPATATSPAPTERGSLDPVGTAPSRLLRAPRSVTRAADDFFHGLVRRVDGDR